MINIWVSQAGASPWAKTEAISPAIKMSAVTIKTS